MTEQEKFEDILIQAGKPQFLVKNENGEYINLATAAMFEVFKARQPEIDALRKELDQVKMHNVMLFDALGKHDYLGSNIRALRATSEQVEAYRAEIIAQSADTIRMDWLVSHVVEVRNRLAYGSEHMFTSQITDHDEEEGIFRTNLREQIDAAIRNNKE